MKDFRFAIMGPGRIARHFCEAVGMVEGCCVAAVASKSRERADAFAAEHGIPAAYGSYEEMLKAEKPDCVYISATTDGHYPLSMLCLDYGVPVLCEKAMFMNSADAETVLNRSKEQNVFVMEALWSRFLPAVAKAKRWLNEGRIGAPVYADMSLCFIAEDDPENRFFNPKLGGGAAFDITVYAYHLVTCMLDRPVESISVESVAGPTGVDVTELILMRFEGGVPAVIKCSFKTAAENALTIQGTNGRIVIPNPHCAEEALLYDAQGRQLEHYKDDETQNGFTYQISETVRCIRSGKAESETVPHSATLNCARLFDRITKATR